MSGQHPPTPQQQAAIDEYRAGRKVIVVKARAGTGKTSLLKMLGREVEAAGEEAGYICFNSSTSREARGQFPRCVQVATAHSFATQASNGFWHHRVPDPEKNPRPRQNSQAVAAILGITRNIAAYRQREIKPPEQAYLAIATVRKFCRTADPELALAHVPDIDGVDEEGQKLIGARILELARHAWEDLRLKHGHAGRAMKESNPAVTDAELAKAPCLNYEHGYYLKRWQLSGWPIWAKRLGPDGERQAVKTVFYDECQDASPVTAAIVENMRVQYDTRVVFVGDSEQAINGFAGNIDVMGRYPVGPDCVHLPLTKSFRFGVALAAEANLFLTLLDAHPLLEGHPPVGTTIGPIEKPDAILTRTNAGAMRAVIEAQAAGEGVYLEGGAAEIRSLAYAAIDLRDKGWTSHQDLRGMTSWQEVADYAREGQLGAEDLNVAVALIDEFTPEVILEAVKKLPKRHRPGQLVVCTAHKSKGLEWDRVRIAEDFRQPRHTENGEVPPDRDELMLSYVAVTRGRLQVDLGSLGWARAFLLRHGVAVAPPAPTPGVVVQLPQQATQDPAGPPAEDPLHAAIRVMRERDARVREGAIDDASDAAAVRAIVEAFTAAPAADVLAAVRTLAAS